MSNFNPREEKSPNAGVGAAECLDSVFRGLADGLLVVDAEERIVLINPAAEQLLGLKQTAFFPVATLADCMPERRLLRNFRSVLGKPAARFEYDLPEEDPRVVTVEARKVPTAEGSPVRTSFLLRDVTYERMLDRLKTEFISTAAHELRTPLTAIMGFSELMLLQDDFSPDERRNFLTFIHRKAEVLARIISDLLDISRIEAGRGLELHQERCDVNQLIRETVQPYLSRPKGHEVQVDLDEECIELQVDRGKIVQVLENLLSNACKYSPKGGRIEVRAWRTDGACQVMVRDQGIGMTREEIRRAFDKFYRADSSNTAVSGTGLGLSIARYIVEAHGGRMWLESRKGRGTKAFFLLPLPFPERFGEDREQTAEFSFRAPATLPYSEARPAP